MSTKKKILILIDWFAPGFKAGGPIQSCVNLCKALKNDYDVYVLTTDTDHGEVVPYNNIISNDWIFDEAMGVHIYYARKKQLSSKQLTKQITEVNADFIYLNHLFSPYFVLLPLWLKLKGIFKSKVVLCPRGALYDSALSLKAYKKKPLLLLYKWLKVHKQIVFHATNEREQDAIQKYFPGSKILIADNLPNTMQQPFQSLYKKPGKLNCLFIARIVPIKNLLFLLKALQMVKQDINLTIIGPVENETYFKSCQDIINILPANIKVDYVGAQKNEALYNYLIANHLFVLPTTGENFGHSIFEALLSGRPVLISDQTPWLHLEKENAGWDLPLDSQEAFAQKITNLANADEQEWLGYAKGAWQYAHKFIATSKTLNQYKKLFA